MKNPILSLIIFSLFINIKASFSQENDFQEENDQRKFDFYFFEGEKEKILGDVDKAAMYFAECLKIIPNSATCYYELANIQAAKNNFESAENYLVKAVETDRNNIWYSILLGEIYQQNGKIDKAISIYKTLNHNDPNEVEYLYALAQLYAQNSNFKEALTAYNLIESSIGINEIISLEKEKLFIAQGKDKLAYKEMESLISAFPSELKFYGYYGDLLMYNGKYSEAKEKFVYILENDSTYGLAHFSLSNLYLQLNDLINFYGEFKLGVLSSSLDFDTKFQRILPILISKEGAPSLSDAQLVEIFNLLISAHPNESRAYFYFANYLKSKERSNEALVEFQKGLIIDPSNEKVWQDNLLLELSLEQDSILLRDSELALINFPENSFFYLMKGISLVRLKKPNNALKSFQEGLKYVENNKALEGEFYCYLGDLCYQLMDSGEAFNYYEKALELDRNNILVLNNYSYYLSVSNINLDKAEAMASKVIELAPTNATYLDTYAWVLFKKNLFFEAKIFIERAMDYGGNENSIIIEHYGDILYKNNDIEGAILQWNTSKEMGNSSKILLDKLKYKKYIEE